MTEQEILDSNILIAEFMGYKYYPNENIQTYTSFRGEMDGDFENVNIVSKHDKLEYCDNDAPSHWKLPKVVSTPFIKEANLQYHGNWCWLMPVVEKIENLTFDNTTQFDVVIDKRGCCITQYFYGDEHQKWQTGLYNSLNKIESVWTCVVCFIKWYNTIEDESK